MSIKEHDGRTDSDTHFQQGGHPSRNQSRTPPAVCSAVSYYFLLDNRKPLSQILYVCCLFRRDYAKHRQKRKEKKQAKEEHKFVVNTEPNKSPIAPMKPEEIAAMRITTDKESQKKE